ncbi:DUF2867 domain-containing protein [Amycolatopsis sp., V23-08]|uniref:DUF2867 domain-containing protein n=1 Tax=Amycolatopsis heterodermiae TaxID=3110235 RepID=A0ABU5R521_9PSEU|nr:DUF2867 domain-containing protein [Amycolatopsis sp., V23-08]MEA5360950.1 DUF2867 domain-containing protein [Amycolatopsis sp., V23-08]
MSSATSTLSCTVLGGTGFVGTALVTDLAAAGHRVRVLSRGREHPFPAGVSVVRGDATDGDALEAAVRGADVVFHLVHSLREPDFAERDRAIAERLVALSAAAGVRQLVYLGGPRPGAATSPHLASRSEVADILLAGPVPAVALQASMILGRGSAGLELLSRTARLPIRPRPGWTARHSRPVALADVRHYLRAAATAAPVRGRLDVSGPEMISYDDLVRRCARVLRRPAGLALPAPLWSHAAAALVAGLASPVPASVAAPLFASLDHDLLPADVPVETVLPAPPGGPTSLDNALRAALGAPAATAPAGRSYLGEHTVRTDAGPDRVWRTVTRLGGEHGRFAPAPAWALRGLLDHALGGVGLYRGRPDSPVPGDVIDSWTVRHRDDAARELVLGADMRLPGDAELTLRVQPAATGTDLRQQVRFTPSGPLGDAYWYVQKPLHDLVFAVLARSIVREASRSAE